MRRLPSIIVLTQITPRRIFLMPLRAINGISNGNFKKSNLIFPELMIVSTPD